MKEWRGLRGLGERQKTGLEKKCGKAGEGKDGGQELER